MEHAIEVASNHPALAGHFPNNPIVPGALVLELVAQAFKNEVGKDVEILGLPRVKFLSPLKPETPFKIVFEIIKNTARFTCSADKIKIASGQLEFKHNA